MTRRSSSTGGEVVDPAILVQWIRRAKRGNLAAYQQIYDQFARKVLNFVYRMVNSVEEAEDLTQETFVTVYQKLGSLQDDTKFEPWLFRIARNYVYQRYRSRQPASVSIEEVDEDGQEVNQLVDPGQNPDQSFQAAELRDVVAQAVAELPEKYREVFVLSAIQHLPYEEIASIVGRSIPSVKTDIHRARLQVRDKVKNYLRG